MAAKTKTLAQRVRDLLASATDPLKAGEIRDLLADDDVGSEQLGTALYQLVAAGTVDKQGERGAYRYLLMPGAANNVRKYRRRPGQAPEPTPDRRRPRPQLVVVDPPQAPDSAGVIAQIDGVIERLNDMVPAVPAADDTRTHTVMLPRRTVRQLVAALLMSAVDLRPYQEAIAEAVRESA
jgi:hypothetical protein